MMFFALPNLSSQEVRKIESPWQEPPAPVDKLQADKTAFGEWCTHPSTKHCFFSLAEGMDPFRRISDQERNRVVALHGFIADIDREIPDSHFQADYIMNRCGNMYPPNYASRTHSNNGRLVWMFEVPVFVPNQKAATEFLKFFASKVKLKKIWGVPDEASYKSNQYFERGKEWIAISGDKIQENELMHWMFESGRDLDFTDDENELRLPMDKINDRFNELYPGKWPGKIEEGARGPAFWRDSRSGNSAIVRRGGIQDFGGDFRTWSSLLGYEWVSQIHGQRIGEVLKNYWTDERNYYYFDQKNPAPIVSLNLTKLERKLRVEKNFSTRRSRELHYTELDEVVKKIDERVVAGVGPFIHFEPGPILVGGKVFLNTSLVRPMQPAPEPPEYAGKTIPFGYNFPYIAAFLKHAFPKDSSNRSPLEYFLSTLRWKYSHALVFKPVRTPAIVLAGQANAGKTFTIEGICAPMFGDPNANSSNLQVTDKQKIGKSLVGQPFAFAVGRTNHNDGLADYPVWSYDDERISSEKEHDALTIFVKQTAALGTTRFNPKHQKEYYTIWRGLQFIACNEDGQSARQMPNVDASILDKLMMFRLSPGFKFLPEAEAIETVRRELPHLCRWLLNWKIPPHCVGKPRFGIEPYHDPYLLRMAYENGANYEFSEMLALFLHNYREQKKANGHDVEEWVGSSSQLVVELNTWNSAAARSYSGRTIGRSLTDLKARGLNIRLTRTTTSRTWHIPVDLALNNEDEYKDDGSYEVSPLTDEDIEKMYQ